MQAPTTPRKLCMKMKLCTHKTVIDGRKHFIGHMQKTGENDLDKLQFNNSGHNEGTVCLVNRRIGARGMVLWAWAHKRASLNLQWLVLRIGDWWWRFPPLLGYWFYGTARFKLDTRECSTRVYCHWNFVPLKILVRDQFFQEKSFHPDQFFLK